MPKRRGLLGTAARTAVVAGTATAVSERVAHRHQRKLAGHANRTAHALPPQLEPARASPKASGSDIVACLQRLAELRSSGALSEKEFAAAKAKLLAL